LSDDSLLLSHDAEVPEGFFEDFFADAKSANIPVEVSTRIVGPMMALEWLLPTTVIVVLTKPFLDAFLKRAADDVADTIYPKITHAISNLAIKVLVSTRGSWRRITKSREVPREGRSPFFSIESETKRATKLKFVFNEGTNGDRYLACVRQALQLLQAHHSGNTPDPFQNAPVDEARNTIYMLYDDDRQRWYAADIYEEIRKIAAESRVKHSETET
jgi:hypothetical protein